MILSLLISTIIILVAISVHEFAHAWMADYLGDPTPRLSGRLTLNPLAHLDPLGTLALFIFRVGWGKPVPIDPYNLRNPKRDSALIALSGPASNVITAIIVAVIYHFVPFLPLTIIYPFLAINLSLAFFNLLPIQPLDGSKVIVGFIPLETAQEVEDFLSRYSLIILLSMFLPIFNGHSLISIILYPLVDFSLQILLFNSSISSSISLSLIPWTLAPCSKVSKVAKAQPKQ